MENKFYTTNGDLTAYALACGHVQRHETDNGSRVDLYYDGCYHVRVFISGVGRRSWDCYATLADARKAWRDRVKNCSQ